MKSSCSKRASVLEGSFYTHILGFVGVNPPYLGMAARGLLSEAATSRHRLVGDMSRRGTPNPLIKIELGIKTKIPYSYGIWE